MKSGTTTFPEGVQVLHDCLDASVDICFIHGLTGDRIGTWTAPGQSSPWPQTFLPPLLPKARVLTYGYDANPVAKSKGSSNRLIDHARNFLADLSSERSLAKASSRPIILIAHGLGGLVCKRSILISRSHPDSHLQDLFINTKGVIFMGTPHKGLRMTGSGRMALSAIPTNTALLKTLNPENEFLQSIQHDFMSMIQEQRERGRRLEITCFFEELVQPRLGMAVSKQSAILEGYNSMSIHANQIDMVKFGSVEDNGFKKLIGELGRWCRDIDLQE